jgi:hypothetical protein
VCNPPRLRRARGHLAAMAVLQPRAPSVVMGTGVWRPRWTRARTTATPLASLSLWAVDRGSKTGRPSTPRPQTHQSPGFLPQRRSGS